MSIEVTKGTVKLTEQTVRELLSAIEEAKGKLTPFKEDHEPKPNYECDMSDEQRTLELAKRGTVTVKSHYSGVEYQISVEKRPQSQESLGYRLCLPEPASAT